MSPSVSSASAAQNSPADTGEHERALDEADAARESRDASEWSPMGGLRLVRAAGCRVMFYQKSLFVIVCSVLEQLISCRLEPDDASSRAPGAPSRRAGWE